MMVAFLSLTLLSQPLAIPVSDRIPSLNVEPLCRATTDDDNSMGLTKAQSFEDCMRDEMTAKQQLSTIWQKTTDSARTECEGESVIGTQSYVDLLTCVQMTDFASALTTGPRLRGASKNRNSNQ
ncbi:hypothetical protein [Bradyrhizobium sp. Ash2021]|uniref:hypothetical protein n=1 Tax=Bradyrhizobium sp. Ash2021 TaxID=2954771 RepID=UPI0028169AEC|nr:hypothetical protein [Bradyrhizobium sp. Ash2021]WMT71710.1 hypothetical protein NL528_26925 [Bradyrhizobium sp. Ash2021]